MFRLLSSVVAWTISSAAALAGGGAVVAKKGKGGGGVTLAKDKGMERGVGKATKPAEVTGD